jgi:hypothetical protein
LQQHTHTGINTHRKQEDDDQRTDSALKNPTPSIHHQHSSPPTLVSIRFRLSVKRKEGRPYPSLKNEITGEIISSWKNIFHH